MDNFDEILKLAGSATVILSVIGFALKKLIDSAVNKSLERFKTELAFESKKREQSALVAELLAQWINQPMDKTLVNKLAWEASLWLPENEADQLNKLLAHDPKGPKTKEMLISIRELIQGCKTSLKANELVHFK